MNQLARGLRPSRHKSLMYLCPQHPCFFYKTNKERLLRAKQWLGWSLDPDLQEKCLRTGLRAKIKLKRIEVSFTQAIRKNSYMILMKTPADMALQAIFVGHLMARNTPMCLFKWTRISKPESNNQVKSPFWVVFLYLLFQYYLLLKSLDETLGKVLEFRPVGKINSR